MANQFWLNLPVKNLEKSKAFFTSIGLTIGEGMGNTPSTAPLIIGNQKVVIMLCEEPTFKGFIGDNISDAHKANEVLLSFDAASKEEVDEIVEKVKAAGGKSNHQPYEMKGNMYGCVFSDIDGHKWNILYMNF